MSYCCWYMMCRVGSLVSNYLHSYCSSCCLNNRYCVDCRSCYYSSLDRYKNSLYCHDLRCLFYNSCYCNSLNHMCLNNYYFGNSLHHNYYYNNSLYHIYSLVFLNYYIEMSMHNDNQSHDLGNRCLKKSLCCFHLSHIHSLLGMSYTVLMGNIGSHNYYCSMCLNRLKRLMLQIFRHKLLHI